MQNAPGNAKYTSQTIRKETASILHGKCKIQLNKRLVIGGAVLM
jgi:hypothetical protein